MFYIGTGVGTIRCGRVYDNHPMDPRRVREGGVFLSSEG